MSLSFHQDKWFSGEAVKTTTASTVKHFFDQPPSHILAFSIKLIIVNIFPLWRKFAVKQIFFVLIMASSCCCCIVILDQRLELFMLRATCIFSRNSNVNICAREIWWSLDMLFILSSCIVRTQKHGQLVILEPLWKVGEKEKSNLICEYFPWW